jgi:hypothetical protein
MTGAQNKRPLIKERERGNLLHVRKPKIKNC